MQFPNGGVNYISGIIKNINEDNYTIEHLCSTERGSSGSPILNLLNYKVIGIHKGTTEIINFEWNLGTLIQFPIDEFNKKMRKKPLNEIFQEIKDKKLDILYEIKTKRELLYLFIVVNNNIFRKKYFGEIFYKFLETNENLIKEYIEKDIRYDELYNYFYNMKAEQEEKEKNDLFIKIKNDIKTSSDKIFNIIASFYYLILYKFKDQKQFREYTNIGNVYLNLILKNFIIFSDQKLKYPDKNLFRLLSELYSLDIKYLISQIYNKENITYSFPDIDRLLLSDKKTKEYYEQIKMKYKQDYNDSTVISVIKFLNSKWREVIYTDFEKSIKLFSISQLVNSNTITILIDCFLCEDNKLINEWQDFMKFFYNETMFYYFGWQSLEKDILKNKNCEEIKKESKNIIDAFNRAKL